MQWGTTEKNLFIGKISTGINWRPREMSNHHAMVSLDAWLVKRTISVHLGVQHHIAGTPVHLDSRYVLLRYLPETPIGWMILVKEIYFVMQLSSISLFPFPRTILAFLSTAALNIKPFQRRVSPWLSHTNPLYFRILTTPVATDPWDISHHGA